MKKLVNEKRKEQWSMRKREFDESDGLKDGSDSYDNPKKKHLLVQVHVYTSESDVVDEYDEAVKQENEENDEDGIPFADDDTDDSNDTGAKAVKQEES
jgi:hypothetical protein